MRVFKRSLCSYKSNQQKFFVFGLGNFGSVYENTRHNIGFNIVDSYAKKYNARLSQTQFDSAYTGIFHYIVIILWLPNSRFNRVIT